MKIIEELIEAFEEELEGAKHYAERYIECKARNNMTRASKYKEMGHDELKHAQCIKDMSATDIASLMGVYQPTAEEDEKWNKAIVKYAECKAKIERILEM